MEGWPAPGTPVRMVVKTWSGKVEHQGLALPPSGPNLLTIKLQNGYNVSFPESYVDSFEELDESLPVEVPTIATFEQDELSLIHI